MKSPLPLPPAAGQQPGTVPAAGPATCRYPGCGNAARTRAGDGPGAPPRYCGQAVAEDRGEHGTAGVTHTALTAFRRRRNCPAPMPAPMPAGRSPWRSRGPRPSAMTPSPPSPGCPAPA